MKRLTPLLLLIFSIIFISCEVESIENESTLSSIDGRSQNGPKNTVSFDFDQECLTDEAQLFAGQNILVGKVTVSVENGNYMITYDLDPGYCLTETHLSVVEAPEDFPLTGGGNPPPGQFEYKDDHACVPSFTYEVPTSKGTFIAAHAVVKCITSTLSEDLPEKVDICTKDQGPDAYLNISVDGGILTGDFGAWCIDDDLFINLETCYEDVSVYLSTGDLPDGAFEYPENFDLVNCLFNQDIVGADSPGGFGTYTYGDLQFAIWKLLDDIANPDGSGYNLGEFSIDRVDELVTFAEENCEGFEPDCGDYVGVILIPGNDVQPLIIPIPVECREECEETAWADGCDFPGNNWATYFEYTD